MAEATDDLRRLVVRDRWGWALMAIGWVHLAFFLVCQTMYVGPGSKKAYFLTLWGLELVVVLGILRGLVGRGWVRSSPMIAILARVWATFLILSFNVATLNTLTGFESDWFKLVWTTLSTFGFATMAWLLSLWFLVPAVQMYFTGLLMTVFPDHHYLIYGASWCLALQGIGLVCLRLRRPVEVSPPPGESEHADPRIAVEVGRSVSAVDRPRS